MFGKNPVRTQEAGDGQRLWIQEVFYTLQGEGPFSGQPAVFIRTAGCNLRCFWCDTDFESSEWRPDLSEITATVESLRPAHCDLIVITGGEPMRQNIVPLIRILLSKGYRVQIETNGTLWLDLPEHENLSIICSPKTPTISSDLVERIDAFKYVVLHTNMDSEDGLPSGSTQLADRPSRLFRPPDGATIYVSPCDERGQLEANIKAATESALKHGYRLSLQTHKIIGLP
ncbi:MAG: radical SAM protein [Methylocystaceae bacterium]|nr:MAG: radical SAM protein [Methylocystaceae bacterium]